MASAGFLLLYGSQTGQAEAIAKDLKSDAAEHGIECRLKCMDDVMDRSAKFEGEKVVVMVCSTTGTGDAPDNASKLLRRVNSKKHPSDHLSHLKFAVLGLGDTNYSDFCMTPRKFHSRFLELGATEFYPAGWADDGTGLDVVVEPWKEGFWPALATALDSSAPTAAGAATTPQLETTPSATSLEGAKISVAAAVLAAPTYDALIATLEQQLAALRGGGNAAPASQPKPPVAGPAASLPSEIRGVEMSQLKLPKLQPEYLVADFTGTAPAPEAATCVEQYVPAVLHSRKVLTAPGAVKEAFSVTLTFTEKIEYAPGDTFAIACPNDPAEVAATIKHLELDDATLDAPLRLAVADGTKKRGAALPAHLTGAGLTARVCLTAALDLRTPLPKSAIRVLAEYATDMKEQAEMLFLCSRQGGTDYSVACTEGGASLIALLKKFPSCKVPLTRLLEVVPCMRPRRYSAASSPLAGDTDVRFILNVEDHGLCSNWLNACGVAAGDKGATTKENLAHACVPQGGVVRVFLTKAPDTTAATLPVVPLYREMHAARFNLPEDSSIPLILCGAGTGVAPMIGFLQHRRLQKQAEPDRVFGETWLFFGCRNESKDYLCRDELEAYLKDGTLTQLHSAFSRDEGATCYVQDNITTHGAAVATMMAEKGGCLYACGSTGCVDSLDNAVTSILVTHLKVTRDAAIDMKIKWKESGQIRVESFGASTTHDH